VRDIDLWKAPVVRVGEEVSSVRAKLAEADLEIPLVVDDQGRPKGWLSERGLQGERVREDFRSAAEPVVELDDILRDALSDLLGADSRYGPVVDANGKVAGVLSMEVLSHALSVPVEQEHIPSAAELAVSDER
jgi:CBS domain-containing protein